MAEILHITGGRVVAPAEGLDGLFDIRAADGVIIEIAPSLEAVPGETTVNAAGLTVMPGFTDLHVHFRDPGQTHKEDILTGCDAAVAGGFTHVITMPNTTPPTDSPDMVGYVLERNRAAKSVCRIAPSACITVGMKGERLTDFAALKAAGAVAVTDDGRPVERTELMREALIQAARCGLLVISHCEDLKIIGGGKMNLGAVSEELGVPGMDRLSEDSITAREIRLAEETSCPVHIAHVSTRGSVMLLREAKAKGIPVTAETGPHYLTFTEEELRGRDANYRMNPPLRERADVEALIEAVADGTIDAICTDHAPHSPEEKADFMKAPNGIIGLESSFAGAYTALVKSGKLTVSQLVERMSVTPAKIAGLPGGHIRVGEKLDVTLADLDCTRIFGAEELRSRSRNCPFVGRELTGKVEKVIVG